MRVRSSMLILWFMVLTMAAADTSRGQESSRPRLDSVTASAIQRIVDRANGNGLPTDVLRAKALEGASRGATGERIVVVVEAFEKRLEVARSILGQEATTEAELVAVAGALVAGVSIPAAESLVVATRSGTRRPVTVPFIIATDLAARGIRADSATSVVRQMVLRQRSDADLWAIRAAVARDIARGADPADALASRSGITNVGIPGAEQHTPRPPAGSP